MPSFGDPEYRPRTCKEGLKEMLYKQAGWHVPRVNHERHDVQKWKEGRTLGYHGN